MMTVRQPPDFPLLVLAFLATTFASAQKPPEPCARAASAPERAFALPDVDPAAVTRARLALRRWPGDVVSFSPTRDSLERRISGTLREALGARTGSVLTYIVAASDSFGDARVVPIRAAAAHFLVILGSPDADLDALLESPGTQSGGRGALFWELTLSEWPTQDVGQPRLRMICSLSRRMLAGELKDVGEVGLLRKGLGILQTESRAGSRAAAALLADRVVAQAQALVPPSP
jgi:hypothetical protein